MSFFSKLFGADEVAKATAKENIRSEINISDAITAHMKWKARLQSYLNGTSQEKLDHKVICRDDQCDLGKWIHGPAQNHFRGDENFLKLLKNHANFHLVAGNVVQKIQENNIIVASSLMNNEYLHASREVINDLSDLHKAIHE